MLQGCRSKIKIMHIQTTPSKIKAETYKVHTKRPWSKRSPATYHLQPNWRRNSISRKKKGKKHDSLRTRNETNKTVKEHPGKNTWRTHSRFAFLSAAVTWSPDLRRTTFDGAISIQELGEKTNQIHKMEVIRESDYRKRRRRVGRKRRDGRPGRGDGTRKVT